MRVGVVVGGIVGVRVEVLVDAKVAVLVGVGLIVADGSILWLGVRGSVAGCTICEAVVGGGDWSIKVAELTGLTFPGWENGLHAAATRESSRHKRDRIPRRFCLVNIR